jgi:hypothetical protein
MYFLSQDLKHLCEFWDQSRNDQNFNDDWRIMISGSQKKNWPVHKKLIQQQLAADHTNTIRLLEQDGFDGNPVMNLKWPAIKKYLDITGWPSSYDILRISDFFHLSFVQTLKLCLKASFERSLLKDNDTPYENAVQIQYARNYIDKKLIEFTKNIDSLKFKIYTRDFRTLQELFLLMNEYYVLHFDFERFKALVVILVEQKHLLLSIFSNDSTDIANEFNKRLQHKSKEKHSATLLTLKVQWLDVKDDLTEKIGELNHILKRYGIDIREWQTGASGIFSNKLFVDLIQIIRHLPEDDYIDSKTQNDLITGIFNTPESVFFNRELFSITSTFFNLDSTGSKLFTFTSFGKSASVRLASDRINYINDFNRTENHEFIAANLNQRIEILKKEIQSMSLFLEVIQKQIQDISETRVFLSLDRKKDSTSIVMQNLSMKYLENINQAIAEIIERNETQIDLNHYEILLMLKSNLYE